MMGKQKAQFLAREERLTWGDLLELIVRPCDRDKTSSLNPALTLAYTQDLYQKIATERLATDIPKAWRPDVYSRRADAVKSSGDFLIVTNILREFGP